MESSEHLATWGSGTHVADAVLRDGVVHKTAGPWTPAVAALLRHLEQVGFAGAPRMVGDGYNFVPGESPHPHAWSDEAVGAVGTLLRGLHDATATFTPPADAVWQPNWLRELGGDEVAEMQGLPDPLTRARHARAVVDGYGLPRAARDALVDRLADVAIHSARHEAVIGGVTIDSTAAIADNGYPVLWGITWRARSASWIARNREMIRRVMVAKPGR